MEEEFKFLLEKAKKQASQHGLKINPDKKMAETAIKGIVHNKKKYGKYYCICKLERIQDNVCMCKSVRSSESCTCGLFVRDESV